jgi:hypothetical protein
LPLAPHLLHQRLDLDLQRRPGERPPGVAEGRPRRLAQIVQRAIEEVDVLSAKCPSSGFDGPTNLSLAKVKLPKSEENRTEGQITILLELHF